MPSIDQRQPYSVITVAMDQRKRAALRMAFKMHHSRQYVLYDDGAQRKPDLAIVDADGPTGIQAWKEFRTRHPKLPGVLLSLNPMELPDGLVIPKPLHVETLLPALDQSLEGKAGIPVSGKPHATAEPTTTSPQTPSQGSVTRAYPAVLKLARAERRPTSAAKKPPPSVPRPIRKVETFVPPKYFDAQRGVLGLLRRLHDEGRSAWLDTEGRRGIVAVLPKEDKAYLDVSEEEFKGLCRKDVELRTRAMGDEAAGLLNKAQLPSLEDLVWRTARWTSRGRLPAGIKVGSTVLHLTRWPNFTRLEHQPDDLRIAAFLSRNRASVALTLKMLKVKPEHLYNFISAAHSLGFLSQTGKKTVEHRPRQEPESSEERERRGVLSRLLQKLVGA